MIVRLKHGDNIIGEEYQNFIKWCFDYSACFSLQDYCHRTENDQRDRMIHELSHHLILKRETTYYQPAYNECLSEFTNMVEGMTPTFFLYNCCETTKQYILKESKTIYDWLVPKLEDLCFYYHDTTVLLFTESHESLCKLSLKEPDILETLFNKKQWLIEDSDYVDQEWYF